MMPSYGIFEDDPRVQALLTEDDCRIPFTEDRYEQIEDLIAERVIKYNIRTRCDLARMHGLFVPGVVLGGQDEGDADENIIKPFLARATTVFHLDSQAAPKCLSYKTLTEIFHLSLVYWMPEIGSPPTWNIVVLRVTPGVLVGKITRELLRVAGAPENSTWEQMKRICGKKLVCTCRKPGFEQPARLDTLVGILALSFSFSMGEKFTTTYSQIQHIRYERTWTKSSEAERCRDEGLEDGSFVDFPTLPPIQKR